MKTVGYNKACVEAHHQFSFLNHDLKNVELSFTSESVADDAAVKRDLKPEGQKSSMVSSVLSSVIELPQSDMESQLEPSMHMLSQSRLDYFSLPTNLEALNRKMYLNTSNDD